MEQGPEIKHAKWLATMEALFGHSAIKTSLNSRAHAISAPLRRHFGVARIRYTDSRCYSLMRHADSNVTLEHYAHIIGDAERVASEKPSQRIGWNIAQLESESELESTPAVKTA